MVVFGADQRLQTPLAVNAGNQIMLTSSGGDEIAVSKYAVHEDDQKRVVSTRIDDVIRAIVELGGTYPDVVQALQEARSAGALHSRFEVDALPEAGRSYDRIAAGEEAEREESGAEGSEKTEAKNAPARAAPELFSKSGGNGSASRDSAAKPEHHEPEEADSSEKSAAKKGFFARMMGQ
jgi:hypothetical protein